ncbi:MAG: hypothetical protein KGR68_17205 [Betaproteobacteria bacterium]|nr:hypothetical protein [Betaproteobacteria bacterium]
MREVGGGHLREGMKAAGDGSWRKASEIDPACWRGCIAMGLIAVAATAVRSHDRVSCASGLTPIIKGNMITP